MSDNTKLDEAEDRLMERASKMAGQLGNWTMAANAGGIAYILTAARDSTVPLHLLSGAYQTFIIGIICGFLGHLMLMAVSAGTVGASGRLRIAEEGLERRAAMQAERKQAGKAPLDFTDLDKADQGFVNNWGGNKIWVFAGVTGGLGVLFYITAAVCAVLGLTAPIALGLFSL